MDIFEYAIQMEKDGELLYRQLADKPDNTGLKKILNMLADDELKHARTLEQMQMGQTSFYETTILADSKNIFEQIRRTGLDSLNTPEGSIYTPQLNLYNQALKIEQKSIDFYQQKSKEVQDDYQKKLFQKLVDEEKKHYFLIDKIIDFLTSPRNWLENAEFVHLADY